MQYNIRTNKNFTTQYNKLQAEFGTDMARLNGFDDRQLSLTDFVDNFIDDLEQLRQKYLQTKDKKYWKELIRWLPESWLQTRTVTMSYENILTIVKQRENHKLNEWSGKDDNTKDHFVKFAETLPYANEFIFELLHNDIS